MEKIGGVAMKAYICVICGDNFNNHTITYHHCKLASGLIRIIINDYLFLHWAYSGENQYEMYKWSKTGGYLNWWFERVIELPKFFKTKNLIGWTKEKMDKYFLLM